MPRRSNKFQRLIYILHKQFSENATVTESKIYKDKETGSDVEIDIVIESDIGGIPVSLGIECTSKSRPATLEWYRQLVQKHNDLAITKTILVSESGFTKDVYTKARLNDVELFTLEEAVDENWIDKINTFKNGSLVNLLFSPKSIQLEFDISTPIPEGVTFSFDSTVTNGEHSLNLGNFVMVIVQESGITRKILEIYNAIKQETDTFDANFTIKNNPKIQFSDGSERAIKGFFVKVLFHSESTRIELEHSKYMGKNIAFAEADNIIGNSKEKMTITFIQGVEGKTKGKLAYFQEDGSEEILNMEFV